MVGETLRAYRVEELIGQSEGLCVLPVIGDICLVELRIGHIHLLAVDNLNCSGNFGKAIHFSMVVGREKRRIIMSQVKGQMIRLVIQRMYLPFLILIGRSPVGASTGAEHAIKTA